MDAEGPPVLQSGRFSGRSLFQQAVRDVLAQAQAQDCSEIILCDLNFWDWPLGERAVHDSLQAWARSGRRCTVIAADFDEIVRRHARFVTWRRTWSHVVECWKCPARDTSCIPSLLWTPGWVLHRIDPDDVVFSLHDSPLRRVQLRESLQDVLAASASAFPASTLGL
jgi:hypothetical protein